MEKATILEEKKIDLWISIFKSMLISKKGFLDAREKADGAVEILEHRFQTPIKEPEGDNQDYKKLTVSLYTSLLGLLQTVNMVADDQSPSPDKLIEAAEEYINLVNSNRS